ncbi:M48 family metalloprotease [Nocardioides humi]|uniref:M48 family metalloprotease n=1 Tax=Nocardioides humi TaxID=449461 RepID=A0ABN2BE89_9ACTN|nr:M48 family metalloprotease [Nocardioides humi]
MLHPLRPLPYHVAVTSILERETPKAFAALGSAPAGGVELDQALLRSTYRLDPASHPEAHAQLARAAEALGVTVPVELYAGESGGRPNAELVHVADRAIVVLTGGLSDLLSGDELCAVLGHELAHHLLWTAEGGRYLVAARLLDAGETDARTSGEHLETARRFRLATELYADRGALVATGSVEPSVGGLIKLATGLRQVDPAAYLRQAAEVDLTSGSSGQTHPENVLRAWALQQWQLDGDAAEERVAAAIGPPLDLAALDVLGQDALRDLTRELVRQAVLVEALRTPESTELAERYGATVPPAPSPLSELSAEDLSALPADTRRYLCAVLADLATCDPDASRDALAAAVAVATVKRLDKDLVRFLSAELGLGDRERSAVVSAAGRLLASPGGAA